MEAKQLARMVLRVLDLQHEYFKTKATEKLQECKRAEAELRRVCGEVLAPPRPSLFDQINQDQE